MTSTGSQQAFLVYCDHAVRHAVEKNNKLRAQNAKLENVRNMLVHMKILLGPNELLNINLQTHPGRHTHWQGENDFLMYNVESSGVEIPFPSLPYVRYEPGNVHFEGGTGYISIRVANVAPVLKVNEEEQTVHLAFVVGHGFVVGGTVKSFAGSVQDLQEMIDSGRFKSQFLSMGFINPTTGQPFTIDSCLDGATFRLDMIWISPDIIHPLVADDEDETRRISEEKVNDGYWDELQYWQGSDEDGAIYNELQVLAKANTAHIGLAKAVLDRKTLLARKWLLITSREIYNLITARYDDNKLRFRLYEGYFGRMNVNRPAWVMHPFVWPEEDDEATEAATIPIPLACIRKIQLDLAKIPWSCRLGPASLGRPVFHGDLFMACMYAPHVEVLFGFDDSLDEVDLDNLPGGVSLHQYVYDVLRFGARPDGPQITMRLLELRVSLPFIEQHLEALGIIEVIRLNNGMHLPKLIGDNNGDGGNDGDDGDDGDE